MSLIRPLRIEPAGVVEPAEVAGPVPAVLGEGLGGQLGCLPVAAEDRPPVELDLARHRVDAHLDALGRATDRPGSVVVERRARAGPGLGRAVALEDRDAEVLPGPHQRRRQERAGREEQAEVPAELAVDAPEQQPPRGERQVSGDATQSIERAATTGLVDLALDGRPEQVQHLGHDDHARDPVLAERGEDDPRIAAADVQDVRADVERVVQPDRLLEQVAERQQRHDPVVHRRDDAVERLDAGDDVVVGQDDALRRAGRAAREDELEDLVGGRGAPRRLSRLPVGREGGIVVGGLGAQVLDGRRREVAPGRPPPDPGRRVRCRGGGGGPRSRARWSRPRPRSSAGRAAR